jgi:hypothetical protein
MRETEANGRSVQNSPPARAALRFSVVALGAALAMTAGAARAADDDNEKSFSDRFIDGIKTTIRGGTSIDDGTIQYRERSPLVVPPRLDLPPPDTASKEVKAPNWPKDPDEGRRRANAGKNKSKPGILDAVLNPFLPSKPGEATSAASAEPPSLPPPPRPDNETAKGDPVYDRAGNLFKGNAITSQLGLSNFNLFGGSKSESAVFANEPTRESLTQPPVGYQTPSPNFAYGAGAPLKNEPHPDDVARAKRTTQ